MRRFSAGSPATWTWAALNAWLMRPGRTAGELRRALRAEGRFRRLTYQLRLQARLNRVEGEAARRRLVGRRLRRSTRGEE